MTQSSSSDHVPTEIGGYRIQRLLGSGGMASVYAGLQKQPRRTVAIKVMRAAARSESALRRFRREIEILGRLRHPNVAQVFDAGMYDDGSGGVPYFVMEYVPRAKTIVEYAETHKLPLRDRLKLFVKVCAAVDHGHRHKVIHRDLKPGNILIDEHGEPKVIDFGVARAVDFDVSVQTQATEAGRLIGTVQYMAPEQLDTTETDLDRRCDVYALGVVLYKLLTGRPPHDLRGLPVFTAAQVIREDAPARPSSITPELKGDLERIILRTLEKDRERRYRSAAGLGRDIIRFLKDEPIEARPAGIGYRMRLFARRHRTELIAAVIVVVVIGGAAAVLLLRDGRATPTPTDPTPAVVDGGPAPPAAGPGGAPVPVAPAVDDREAYVLMAHAGEATGLAFDASGRQLATGGVDQWVRIWAVDEPGRVQRQTQDHDGAVRHLAFSPDGTRVVSAGDDAQSVVLNVASGRWDRIVRGVCAPVRTLASFGRGDRLALACNDLTVRYYAEAATERFVLRSTRGNFGALAFGPEGARLAGGTEGGSILVWELERGTTEFRFGPYDEPVLAMAFDGPALHVVTADGVGRTWFLPDGAPGSGAETPEAVRWSAASGPVTLVAFAPDGRFVTALVAGVVEARDVDGRPARVAAEIEQIDAPRCLAVAPGGRWVAVGAADGSVHLIPYTAP